MPPTPKRGGSKRCFAERELNCFYFQISFYIFLTCLEMLLKLAESWLICGYRFHQKDFCFSRHFTAQTQRDH